jgi:hypothetical protein
VRWQGLCRPAELAASIAKLTRRANHWHIAIIEELLSPREKSLRAFSLSRHHQSDGGAPRQDATPLYRASSDSAPSSELL